MAGSKILQFVLLITFMIFSTHALDVILTDGKGRCGFKYETVIDVRIDDREIRHYNGCVRNNGTTYAVGPATTKVIVYIKSYDIMKSTTLKRKHLDKRHAISETLREHNYELLYLGVHGFKQGDERLIAEFLLRSIEPNPYLEHFLIDIIGEKSFNLIYPLPLYDLLEYKEEEDVLGGNLLGELRSML